MRQPIQLAKFFRVYLLRVVSIAIALGVTLFAVAGPAKLLSAERRNVLLIAIDDLRPELGCYGVSQVKSPNIDALAKTALVAGRAYCQQAVCNPSRTSLMTGQRPDSIGVVSNHVHFRDKQPEVVTLPQHFRQHGYHAQAIGKIYHGVFPDGASKTVWDTMGDPPSWSAPAIRFGPRYYYTESGVAQAKQAFLSSYRPKNPAADDWTKKLVFGPMTEAPDVSDDILYDGQVASSAVQFLNDHSVGKRPSSSQPFFLAVGFIKPHSPFVAPKKYWDMYDPAAIDLATNPTYPENAPTLAGHGSHEVRRYTDQPNKGAFSEENRRRLKHGYYACISYIDAQVGRVLAALEENKMSDSTIVVLFGDHGWHLGEHDLWGKTTNFELDTRAPLIIRHPKMKSAGSTSQSLVEFVDIYPTLTELAGLPRPAKTDGSSFASLLDDSSASTKSAAYSQYPRGKLMGYSMRTDRYRYTEWIDRSTRQTATRELYDHESDPRETINVADKKEYATAVAQLSKQLAGGEGWRTSNNVAVYERGDSLNDPLSVVPIHTSVAGQSAVQLSDELKSTPTSTSFEQLKAGALGEQSDASGSWKSESGHATVHVQHQRTGKQSLRLLGGEKHIIEWTPAATTESETKAANQKSATKNTGTKNKFEQLEFWFERWTRRTPFDFRVSVLSEGNWKTLHHDTRKAIVGSFKNRLTLPLVGLQPEKFRFESTTPANSGVMIDDLRLTVAKPMQLKRFEPIQTDSPVLIRNEVNPVLGIELEAEGSQSPITAGALNIRLDGTTNLGDIEYVEAYWAGTAELPIGYMDGIAEKFQRYGEPQKPTDGLIEFKDSVTLSPGINRFWISVKLKDTASLTNHIGVVVASATVDRQGLKYSWVPVGGVKKKLRIGYAVRKAGDDKSRVYRIPGLCRTNKGTLIGVYDVRYRGGGDLPGDIDVGMSRSTDGGQTWEPMKVIMDMGDDPKWRYDGVGDPAVMVDRKTNTIWVAGTWSHGNRSWVGSGPGLKPAETGQFMLTKSEDDGVTWSKPINITKQIKKPEWCFVLQGPGRGITMQNGTLVFCAQYQDPPENRRLPHSTIIYSKDRGETWQIGTGAYPDTTESAVAEIEPGVLMLNCRYNRQNRRVVMITRDMGKTWTEHPTSRKSLPEPGSCMASMVTPRSDLNKGINDWVLFSNPNVGNSPRRRMTIKASNDRGATWPTHWHTLIDEGPSAGYSCLTMVDEKHVGILFEGNRSHMTFLKIPLSELTHVPVEFKPAAKETSLRLPQVFQDHMVLQRDKPIPVWGTAAADASVSVSFGDKTFTTKANGDGNWRVDLPAQAANSRPVKLTITSRKTVVIEDVLVGDVWIAAGQSNMEWPLAKTDDGAAAIQSADDPQLRLLYLRGAARGGSGNYTDDHLRRLTVDRFCQGNWQVSSPQSVAQFSAVAYYFARKLRRETGIPVGVICPAIGGTPAEAWIRREALASSPQLAGLVKGNWMENKLLGDWCPQRAASNLAAAMSSGKYIPADDLGPNHSFKPCFMWDSGVAPLVPYAISGFIWYQGESNAQLPERTAQHPEIFSTLIRDWRKKWATSTFASPVSKPVSDLPFLFVQLPALNRPHWPEFRDGQRRVANQLDNVGMAITIDTGNPSNVHPTDKTQVGERLASLALKMKTSATWNTSGPSVESAKLDGGKLRVSFRNCNGELRTVDGKPPKYFEVASEDKKFIPIEVQIQGKTVMVESGPLADVRYVRYAWIPWPDPPVNMCDEDMLPMSPFEVKVTK